MGNSEILKKAQRRMFRMMIPSMWGSYEDKIRKLGMTTIQQW